MSVTTVSTETVTVSKDDLVELVAAIYAAGDLVATNQLEGMDLDGETLGDAIQLYGQTLRERFLGQAPESDDEWNRDPLVVAIGARTAEIEAELLDRAVDVMVISTKARLLSSQRRDQAKQMREAGTYNGKGEA